MENDTSSQGSGLSVAGLILMAVAFVVTFILKQCIFGTILAIVSIILASAGYMETRRTGGNTRFTIIILIISIVGTIIHIGWIASGPSSNKPIEETEIIDTIMEKKGEEVNKEEILKELEEKAEQLEKEGGKK